MILTPTGNEIMEKTLTYKTFQALASLGTC